MVVQAGISKEKGKEIIAAIKDSKLKVQAQIQDEQVRVTGKNRDDLQAAIAHLRGIVGSTQSADAVRKFSGIEKLNEQYTNEVPGLFREPGLSKKSGGFPGDAGNARERPLQGHTGARKTPKSSSSTPAHSFRPPKKSRSKRFSTWRSSSRAPIAKCLWLPAASRSVTPSS